MSSEPDQITEAIRRALDAAEAANAASEDIAGISAAHRSFAEKVALGQKRSSALAGGAALGALLGLGLGGLIWFRSVADLREAGEVQAVAAELLAEQVGRFDTLLDQAQEREAQVTAALAEMTRKVGFDLAKLGRSQQPMEAQIATAIREGVKADLDAARDQLLAAITARQAGAGGIDSPEVKVLLEEMQAIVAGMTAPAARPAAAAPAAQTRPASRPAARPASARPAKPAEPDPFVYP